MGVKVTDGRLKPKSASTFGKKPYKGKGKNRKGSLKNSFSSSGAKKISYLNPDKPVRFTFKEYRRRQTFIRGLGVCQVCDESCDLDAPHHVMQGVGVKDDRFLINICDGCHRMIHTVGYIGVKKTKEECKEIAWSNHLKFEEEL